MHTPEEAIRAIGRLEGMTSTLEAAMIREIAALRRDTMGHIAVLHRLIRQRGTNGGHKPLPWAQIAAMATVAVSSLLGLLSPEKAAAILRAIAH